MKVVGIIPARMNSTRLPNKPLAKIWGKSMIEHVYKRTKCAELIDDVFIATCDEEIAIETEKFGGKYIMTSDRHTRGTDRVAEAAESIEADYIFNIQGDEPLVDPKVLDAVITQILEDKTIKCINLVSLIKDWQVFCDFNVVKAVVNQKNEALYFSRQPIPTTSEQKFISGLKQIGIYIFQKQFLLDYISWDETPLEQSEMVDMMRILEKGFTINTFLSKDMVSVDTSEDLTYVTQLLKDDELCKDLFGELK
ncbi:MAG: 3-deoxy-manno-octulosonate cytidylyltransferase [Pseudomonadota bacterium]